MQCNKYQIRDQNKLFYFWALSGCLLRLPFGGMKKVIRLPGEPLAVGKYLMTGLMLKPKMLSVYDLLAVDDVYAFRQRCCQRGRENPNFVALQVVDRVVGSLVDGNGVDTRRREYIS